MEEMLDIVDRNDKVVGKATRKEARENALMHRVARVIVFNKLGKLLVQKRARNKDIYPSYWDLGIAETVRHGESYENAALRGLKEEAGITSRQIDFLFKIEYHSKIANEFCSVYELEYDGEIKNQDGETEELFFTEVENLKSIMEKEKFHPVGKIVFERYMETILTRKC